MTLKYAKRCFSVKKLILTSEQHAELSFAGWNTQHLANLNWLISRFIKKLADKWGLVNLSKVLYGAVSVRFWGTGGFLLVLSTMPQIFPTFFSSSVFWGTPCWLGVSLRSLGRAFWLIRCPPSLCVAFNKIISGEKIWGMVLNANEKTRNSFSKTVPKTAVSSPSVKLQVHFFVFDRFSDPDKLNDLRYLKTFVQYYQALQQQWVTEKVPVVEHRKGSVIADNRVCVGVRIGGWCAELRAGLFAVCVSVCVLCVCVNLDFSRCEKNWRKINHCIALIIAFQSICRRKNTNSWNHK